MHLQVVGIWDPYELDKLANNFSKKNSIDLLSEFNLNDNYFSIRGELVFVNTKKKEFVMKICSSSKLNRFKNNNFKLVIEGELSLAFINSFLSLDVIRIGNTLRLVNYEFIEKLVQKNKSKMKN